MNFDVFFLTLRQLVGRRSVLVVVVLALLPLLVAVVFRLSEPEVDPDEWAARFLLQELVVTAVLPLSALLVGVWTLGDELEDGTAVYLLAKPLPRWQILLPKMAAAALVTGAVVLSSTAAAGLIALAYQGDLRVLGAFLVGVGLGCIAYTAVFVLMSLVTSRALIAGLTYLFVWETSVTALFEGTRYFSLRQQVLGIADWLSGTSPEVFDAYLGGLLSLVLILVVTVAAAIYAEQRLEQVEVREST